MKQLFRIFTRNRADQGALASVLAEAPLPETRDLPVEVEVSAFSAVTAAFGAALQLFVILGVLGVTGYIEIGWLPLGIAGLGLVVAMAYGAITLQRALRSVRVSEAGVRVERFGDETLTPWHAIRGVGATQDLSSLRFTLEYDVLTLDLSTLRSEQRRSLAISVRARLLRLQDITRWSPGWGSLRVIALRLSVFATLAGYVFFGLAGNALGTRCSGPSSYMQQRFNLPAERGCVVLGVSGAAERAGLRQGDLIVAMNGIPITSGQQFGKRFADHRGRDFTFTVYRGGVTEPFDVELTLGRGGSIELPKDDPLFWFRKARANVNGDPQQRIEDYTKAIELAPDFDLAYLYRGELYFVTDPANPDLAWQDYETAIAINPYLAEAHRLQGRLVVNAGYIIPSGLEYALKAIELDECDTRADLEYNIDCRDDYDLLADHYMVFGDPREAEARQRAREFYPGSEPSWRVDR